MVTLTLLKFEAEVFEALTTPNKATVAINSNKRRKIRGENFVMERVIIVKNTDLTQQTIPRGILDMLYQLLLTAFFASARVKSILDEYIFPDSLLTHFLD